MSTTMQAIKNATHVYVGRTACGCPVAVVTDLGKECARDVADMVRRGYFIERVTFEDYRAGAAVEMKAYLHDGCPHQAKQGALL